MHGLRKIKAGAQKKDVCKQVDCGMCSPKSDKLVKKSISEPRGSYQAALIPYSTNYSYLA